MSPSQPPRGSPVSVLVVSSRLTDARRGLLAALAIEAPHLEIASGGADLPGPEAFDALIVDGWPTGVTEEWIKRVADHVERGARLLAIGSAAAEGGGRWSDLLGATTHGPLPRAEWFAKLTVPANPLTRRVPAEFAVSDQLEPLSAQPSARPVLAVSVGYSDRPALCETRRGEGRVAVSGLGNDDSALANTELVTVLRRALRSTRVPNPGRDLGMAIVGYGAFGGMGHHHAMAAASTEGLELVAVCDSAPERRKAAENDLPGVRVCARAEEIASDDGVDLVVVATPPISHAGVTMAMLRAGKHVACEKPLCLTTGEAHELIAAATVNDVCLTVNHSRRWDRDFVAIRRAVETGLLGELFCVETFVGGFEHPCREWHSEVSVSGGTAYDWGAHHMDWILVLMGGPPRTVRATGHKRVWHDVTNLDQLRAHLVWEDGREAEFVHSEIAALRRPKFYLQGTAGTLVGRYRPLTFERMEPAIGLVAEEAHHAEAPAELTMARYESGYGVSETTLPLAPEQRFAFHRNLADHLHSGEPLAVTAESAGRVVSVLEAAQRSAEQAGTVLELDRQ